MKRELTAIWLGTALAALAQVFLPAWPWLGGAKPPLTAVCAVYWALNASSPGRMWQGVFWAAVLHDAFTPGRPGAALLAYPIAVLPALRARFDVFAEKPATQVLFGGIGAGAAAAGIGLFYALTRQRSFFFDASAWLRIAGEAVLGALTLPLIAPLLDAWRRQSRRSRA